MKITARNLIVLLFFSCLLLPGQAQEATDVKSIVRVKTEQTLLSGPGNNFKPLHISPPGELLEVIGTKGLYYRVRIPCGFFCYIHSEYVLVDENQMGTVTGNRVNLRSIPSKKSDWPIFKVDRGHRLPVWGRDGDWLKVSAPPEAYAYVLIDEVEVVADTAEVRNRIAAEKAAARAAWEDRVAGIHSRRADVEREEALRNRLAALEGSAVSGFAGCDLADVKRAYEEIAAATTKDEVRQLAQARSREIALLQSEKKLQQEVRDREERARQAEKRLAEEKKKAREAEKAALLPTGDLPTEGMRITVLGRVDSVGDETIIRGGLTPNKPLYRIACPDGRYVLADFRGKRIAVRGVVGQFSRDKLPLVKVERIEISP